MSPNQPSRRENWLVSAALSMLFATLLLAAFLAAGVLGVRYGVVPGPSLTLKFGTVQVIAGTNDYPDCNPLVAACVAAARNLPAHGAPPRFYSVWVVTNQKVPVPGTSAEDYGGTRMFAIQAGP